MERAARRARVTCGASLADRFRTGHYDEPPSHCISAPRAVESRRAVGRADRPCGGAARRRAVARRERKRHRPVADGADVAVSAAFDSARRLGGSAFAQTDHGGRRGPARARACRHARAARRACTDAAVARDARFRRRVRDRRVQRGRAGADSRARRPRGARTGERRDRARAKRRVLGRPRDRRGARRPDRRAMGLRLRGGAVRPCGAADRPLAGRARAGRAAQALRRRIARRRALRPSRSSPAADDRHRGLLQCRLLHVAGRTTCRMRFGIWRWARRRSA